MQTMPGKNNSHDIKCYRDLRQEILLFLHGFLLDLFVACLFVYFISLIADKLSKGFVSDFFDPNILFFLSLATGSLAILASKTGGRKHIAVDELPLWFRVLTTSIVGAIGGFLIYAISTASTFGRMISALVGAIIIFAVTLVLISTTKAESEKRDGTGPDDQGQYKHPSSRSDDIPNS